jgi:hypothetical protein
MRRQMMMIESQPRSRRRAPAARRDLAMVVTCAQIGMMLDAPRAAREQSTQGGGEGREGPSVVDTLFGCCRSAQKG